MEPTLIALIAALGSCASALLSFLAVREMRAQRIMQYRPLIEARPAGFVVLYDGPIGMRYRVVSSSSGSYDPTAVGIVVANVGVGPAIDVKCSFDFDVSSIASDLAVAMRRNQREVEIEENFVIIRDPNGQIETGYGLGASVIGLDTMQPTAQTHVAMARALLAMSTNAQLADYVGGYGLPRAPLLAGKLVIMYTDINGMTYEDAYAVTASLTMFIQPDTARQMRQEHCAAGTVESTLLERTAKAPIFGSFRSLSSFFDKIRADINAR